MARPEKVAAVAHIKERLETSRAVFITEYRGLSVADQQRLRRGLRAAEAEYKVFKMTLARRAAEEAGYDNLLELLQGPTAIAFTNADPVPTAKALKEFADENAMLVLKGGLLAGEPLTSEKIIELAQLETREVLLAKLAGAVKAPAQKMAGLMGALLRGTATMVSQLIDKGGAAGGVAEEPAAESEQPAAAAEEPAAETAEEEAAESEEPAAEAAEEPAAEAAEEPAAKVAEEPAAEATEEPAAEAETEAPAEAEAAAEESSRDDEEE